MQVEEIEELRQALQHLEKILEALKRIKADPVIRSIPVYMLTTTDNPVEVNRCFELGCNAYLTKPISYDAFIAAIQNLCSFLEVTQLPAPSPTAQNVSA